MTGTTWESDRARNRTATTGWRRGSHMSPKVRGRVGLRESQ
jgi:hypothetical protein